jgi:hypothetical protein
MAALWALASEAGTGLVVTAATVAGALAGGIGFVAVARHVGRARRLRPEAQMEARGLVLWVRVRTQVQEDKAIEILKENSGHAVRVHEIEIAKRPEDLPACHIAAGPVARR